MAHFDHKPAVRDPDNEIAVARNTRYGLLLFAVYTLLYATFMILNTFTPSLMEREIVWGINLAVWYGLGLIVTAFLLALLYAWICRAPQRANPDDREGSL
jgi:uncharacterized membrane protein (DUF485 family)